MLKEMEKFKKCIYVGYIYCSKIAADPKYHEGKGTYSLLSRVGGVISNISTHPCEHFLCKEDVTPANDKRYFFQKSCLVNAKISNSDVKGSKKNQNREHVKDIYMKLGDNSIDRRGKEDKTDEWINAPLYRYEPPSTYDKTFHTFTNNGAIGIIIKDNGLSL